MKTFIITLVAVFAFSLSASADDNKKGEKAVRTMETKNNLDAESFKNIKAVGKAEGRKVYSIVNPDGSAYIGAFDENEKQVGFGKFTWTNGDKFVGVFEKGKRNGLTTTIVNNTAEERTVKACSARMESRHRLSEPFPRTRASMTTSTASVPT